MWRDLLMKTTRQLRDNHEAITWKQPRGHHMNTTRPSRENREAITSKQPRGHFVETMRWIPRGIYVKTAKRPSPSNHEDDTTRHLRENSKEAISLKPHGDTTRYSRENNKEAISWKPWGEYHEAFTWKQQRGHLVETTRWIPRGCHVQTYPCSLSGTCLLPTCFVCYTLSSLFCILLLLLQLRLRNSSCYVRGPVNTCGHPSCLPYPSVIHTSEKMF